MRCRGRNGTRRWNSTDVVALIARNPQETKQMSALGRENRALGRSCGIAQEIAILKLAERVGVFDRDFAIPNVYSGFRLISRDRNDLASSNLRLRFRPFAGVCQFFYFDGTRNGIYGLLL
jgi:hypothetical protein